MQLQNLLQHKKGTSVSVNGHVYKIGLDLVVRDASGNAQDVPQIDADKLLSNPEAWKPLNAPTVKHERSGVKAGLKVVMSDGSVLAPVSLTEEPTKPVAVSVSEIVTPKDPPIPKNGEEWADPSLDCSLAWLQACASAYKIKFKGKDKPTLVEKIKAAMYE